MKKTKVVTRAAKRVGKTRKLLAARKPASSIRLRRKDTKQSQLIALLRRSEGMTVAQACAALDWKAHTVRGAIAGTIKGRLKLKVGSEKPESGDRVYRIVD